MNKNRQNHRGRNTLRYSALCGLTIISCALIIFFSGGSQSISLNVKNEFEAGKKIYVVDLVKKDFAFACMLAPYEDYASLKHAAASIGGSITIDSELLSEDSWALVAFDKGGKEVRRLIFDRSIVEFCENRELKCSGKKSLFLSGRSQLGVNKFQACLGD